MLQTNFFRLLRYALGTSQLCPTMSVDEWRSAFEECERQTIAPFVGKALEAATNVLSDPTTENRRAFRQVLGPWMNAIVVCKDLNSTVNRNALGTFWAFEKAGMECCLLKGQGNAALYPNPSTRVPGDIDIWLRRKLPQREPSTPRDIEADIDRVIALGRQMDPKAKIAYHHIQCPPYHETSVEAHYRPQFMFLPSHNRRIQKYFFDNADAQFANKINIEGGVIAAPTAAFNTVFQLSHIFNHLFHEGIGMRQIIDYYYVVTCLTPEERAQDWAQLLNGMGLRNMCGAVMWILTEVLGMPAEFVIVAPDERRGHLVLSEIMAGGNFGKYDERHHWGTGAVALNLQRLVRDVRLVRWFPSEALAEPFFRLWHYLWRVRKNKSLKRVRS